MTWFVDTNIFIRLLTRDDPGKADAVAELFRRAARGEVQLTTSEAVLAEILYVLRSPVAYRMSREEAATLVTSVVALEGLDVRDPEVALEALAIFAETDLDFVDCLAVGHTRQLRLEGVYSYDRGFDAVDGLVRREPEAATN